MTPEQALAKIEYYRELALEKLKSMDVGFWTKICISLKMSKYIVDAREEVRRCR